MIHDPSTYDLISLGLGGRSFQEFVDSYLFEKYNGLKIDGFDFDPNLQLDYTYQQLEAEYGLYTMPSYIAPGSPSPVKSNKSISVNFGTIPHNSHSIMLDEQTLRLQAYLNQQTGAFTEQMRTAINMLLFDSSDKLIGGNYSALTYQRDQMVSNFALTLTDSNDPQGLKGITMSANVPAANTTTLASTAKWFTDASDTEGSASDPIKDLQAMIVKIKNKGVRSYHFEIDELSLMRMFNHSKVKAALAVSMSLNIAASNMATAESLLNFDVKKAMLSSILGCPVISKENVVAVEKFDKTTGEVESSQIRSFNPNTIVLVPDGQIGTIKSAQPVLLGSVTNGEIASFDDGRTLLRRYYDIRTNRQYIQSDNASLAIPTSAQKMFRLIFA